MKKHVNLPFLLLVYIVIFCYHLRIHLVQGSDDTWFAAVSKNGQFLKWISSRYETWSGRLFPDSMLYFLLDKNLMFWRILSSIFLLLLAIYVVKIIKKDVARKELIISILLIGFISSNVLNAGFFWATGSINYLWPISLGLVAMYPFANRVFEFTEKIPVLNLLIFMIAGLLAAISNEQVALCMSAFSLITLLFLAVKRKIFDKGLLILTIIILVGSGILLLAPGNKVRWAGEVDRWFPGYGHLTLLDKVHLGLIWLYQQLFVELRNLILLLSLVIFIIHYKSNEVKKLPFYIFSIQLFIAISTIILGKTTGLFYDFQLINQFKISHSILHFWTVNRVFIHAIFPYIYWTIFSGLLLYLILVKTKFKYFNFLCLSAAIATFVILFFSPTIYASGVRTLTVGSVLILIVIMNLLVEFDLLKDKLSILLLGCLPLLNLLLIFVKL